MIKRDEMKGKYPCGSNCVKITSWHLHDMAVDMHILDDKSSLKLAAKVI